MSKILTNKMTISIVLWIDRHSGISQKSFRTSSRNLEPLVASINLLLEVGHHTKANLPIIAWDRQLCAAFQFETLDFKIGDGRTELDISVHDAIHAIDGPIFEKSDESFRDSFASRPIHCEGFTIPINRQAQASLCNTDFLMIA